MATYNASAVADSVIGFQKPITLQQGRALRDNPIATAEGQTNAPRVEGKALGGISLGAIVLSSTPTGFINLERHGLIRGDFGTGSGLVAIAATMAGARVHAVEIGKQASEIARLQPFEVETEKERAKKWMAYAALAIVSMLILIGAYLKVKKILPF